MIISTVFLFISCKEELKNKQQEIQKREDSLFAKEKRFALKEAEYTKLLKMRDSIIATRDSTNIISLPVNIDGKWNGRVVCIESNCQDYVVGDTRVDEWEIIVEQNEVTLKDINKAGVVRVYKGQYDGSVIRVTSSSDPEAEKQRTFKIELNSIEERKISGIREVQVNNACSSKFSIELTRQK